MTEPQGSAAVQRAGNPEVGSSAAPADGAMRGMAQSAWADGLLSEENRAKAQAKGWKTFDDAVTSYSNLESQLGRSLTPPSEGDDPERWDAFYAAAGRPETPDGYDFALPEALPESFVYTEDLASAFREWAHGSGLNPRQAQGLHDRFVRYQADQYEDYAATRDRQTEEAHDRLVGAWGDPQSETYRRKLAYADRALRNLGGDELREAFQMGGLITEEGALTSAALGQALARVGEALFAEDGLSGSGADVANPWADATENLSRQGQILRQDPDKARALIRAAGLDPTGFGLA